MEEETICYLCGQAINIKHRFILYEEGCAHTSCFDADYLNKEVIDLDRMVRVRPGGVLISYDGEESEDLENIIDFRRRK